MKWFKKDPERAEMVANLLKLRGELEVKKKECEFFEARGDRYFKQIEDREKNLNEGEKRLESRIDKIFDLFSSAEKLTALKMAIELTASTREPK